MIKQRIAKFAAVSVGVAMAIGAASPLGAQTVADLQAQINALLAQLSALQGGASTTTTVSACAFTRSLTVGSNGSDVTCLQQTLVAKGYLVMPAGVAMGYFGNLTKAAVARWQAANGVAPAVGYFGPISQAKFASMGGTTIPGGTTTGGGITTPGVEGTLTASIYATPATGTKVYEGDDMKKVLAVELEAKLSDVRVERIKLKLDAATSGNTDRDFYDDIADRIYIMDGNTVLASASLNSSTVIEETTGNFYVTVTGFNLVIPKDSKKILSVALDAQGNFDSAFSNDSWTLTVPAEGIRGVDGAGINLYAPSSGTLARNFSTQADLSESASLAVSLNSNSPKAQQVICTSGSDEDECNGLELARFDFKAEDDTVTVTNFVLDIVRTNNATPTAAGNVASGTVAYLYDGSNSVGSASVVSTSATVMTATFTDIDWDVPADTTRTLSVRLDIIDAQSAADTLVVSTDAADVTAENSDGDDVSANVSGSADGKTFTIRKVGPEITLVSKSITTSGVPQSSAAQTFATSTLTATFNVKIKALGGSIVLGKVASTTGPTFGKTTGTNSFTLYSSGSASSLNLTNGTTTSFTLPSTCVDDADRTNSCQLAENAEITVPVTFLIPGRTDASSAHTSGLYSVGLINVNWSNTATGSSLQSTNFMSGDVDWRTAEVSFP